MKIALLSDIHANLPALEACLDDIDQRKPDAIFCLGDFVGYNIWSNEVIQIIRQRGIPAIAGNYDFGIGRHSDECGCAYKTERDKEMGKVSIAYTNASISEDSRNYLRTLPAHIRITYQLREEPLTLLLVHGSPRRINEYLFEDRDEKSLLRIMESAGADILCFGHTHKPYHRILNAGPEEAPRYLHAINTGSVGKPKDGDPRGCYVILTINEDLTTSDRDKLQAKFIRFDYDIERAAKAVEDSPLPDEYAMMLRKGI